jgi:hypothetical protein
MRLRLALVGWVCTVPAVGCTRSAPPPPSVSREAGTPLSVFSDTAVYRRYCEVPAGERVNLEQPCLLRDQGRPPVRRPPLLIP